MSDRLQVSMQHRFFCAAVTSWFRLQIACLVVVLVLLSTRIAIGVDQRVLDAEAQRIAVMRRVAASVVCIFGDGGRGGGSGVLISADGYALSNYHVTSTTGSFFRCGLNDGQLYDAVIVGVDPTGDVAMLKLLGREDFPFAESGDSDRVRVGHSVFAMGNPFLLATDFTPTVTWGMVSGIHRYQYGSSGFLEYTDCIQVDASINPGNSGGPLFDERGRLIGINGRISSQQRGRVNSGAGYAISINQVRNFHDHLRSGRIVDHASLGATVATDPDGNVVVDRVLADSEAWRRGLRPGMELVSFAGRPIRSVNQFKNVLGIYPRGWRLPLVWRVDGETHRALVRLRGLHRESELVKHNTPGMPRQRKPEPGAPGSDIVEPQSSDGPEQYRHMFIERAGYANYYFNQVEQKRLFPIVDSLGDFCSLAGSWILSGTTDDDTPFEFVVADNEAALSWGNQDFHQRTDNPQSEHEPEGARGILVALNHLRLLLLDRRRFTDVYYLGSEPLDGTTERVDVLVTVMGPAETRWYFDRHRSALVGFDTRIGDNTDDCEVRIHQWSNREGRRLPREFEVRQAGARFGLFRVIQEELRAAATQT